uniref:Casein kinase I n=1 Tax=Zooxanthella nutricula TaxID=1333877 RepID=A0A7S2JAM2_9DINO|mmetsp:Transcript_28333/g.85428  ORF Transcript_28333/g.85428 Transcript_28333/m.85428 type:complete len:360 (+) Transcript_28333:1-1080(+)
MDLCFGGRYRLCRRIGAGSFGDIYTGVDLQTDDAVAIKLESVTARNPQLQFEARAYEALAGGAGIPRVRWCGVQGNHTALVLDLLGQSLEALFNLCNEHFSMKTVVLLAEQVLNLLEFVHSKEIVHRDVKPDNFLMGLGPNAGQVYLIDFGLAKRYWDAQNDKHLQCREGKALTGTTRYASVNAHLGIEQSRRDDLESAGYMFMYFLRGGLPWQHLRGKNRQASLSAIAKSKMATTPEVLARNYPPQFREYLNYCRRLKFEERPEYEHLRQLFRDLCASEGFSKDLSFDWTPHSGRSSDKSVQNDNLSYYSEGESPCTVHQEVTYPMRIPKPIMGTCRASRGLHFAKDSRGAIQRVRSA